MGPKPWPEATTFNNWYADMAGLSVKDEIVQRHLGLPPALLSTSLLGWEGIGEVTEALRLPAGGTLLDLACGRGGYGLEIAARTGAVLIGVDFSAEAVRQAREHAKRLGRMADFRVGDLAATGLLSASVNAVVCVDAIQFACQSDAAYRELLRVLAPGGRVAVADRPAWRARDCSGYAKPAGHDRSVRLTRCCSAKSRRSLRPPDAAQAQSWWRRRRRGCAR